MPLISVLIPTRERCGTLGPALRTLCNQDFSDCEFVVSDNASQDDTEAIVSSFKDPRVRYIRTPKRVSMTSNFNFAIEHSRGTYVICIGDDDGLTPGALGALAYLIDQTGADAISWRKASYFWPDHPVENHRNSVRVPILSGAWNVSARAALFAATWGLLSYSYLPIVYHGVVKRSVLDLLRAKTGMFLKSEIPDIYSAIAISTQIANYIFVEYPYSMLGHAANSNGSANLAAFRAGAFRDNDSDARFWQETEMEPPKGFSSRGVRMENAGVLENLYRVREVGLDNRSFMPISMWLWRLACDARHMNEPLRTESIEKVEEFAGKHRRKNLFRLFVKASGKPLAEGALPLVSYGSLVLNGDEFGLKTIDDATRLVAKIRRPPKLPVLRSAGLRGILRIRMAPRRWGV
jgi:glycosyltransferase involved in cell wall biosynthesis